MSEIIKAADIARIIRCDPCLVRHKMRTGEWKFGRSDTARQEWEAVQI